MHRLYEINPFVKSGLIIHDATAAPMGLVTRLFYRPPAAEKVLHPVLEAGFKLFLRPKWSCYEFPCFPANF